MKGTKPKTSKVPQIIVDMMSDHFLEAGQYLRDAQENHPEDFRSVAKQLKIGTRKAYNLAQISRTFDELGIPMEQLRRIGWTKLALLASYVDADNINALLAKAAASTAHELKMYLHEKEFDPEGRTVVLHLDSDQYAVFKKALQKSGAIPHSKGLLNKEVALTELLNLIVSNEITI
ncbi:hypothetical protein FJQ54_04425 [Sandaracinobacter neustonicus]|uniref:Uncharacterized protein n=1 Tax=Sandaracinobacter neustonicus TaxID=1715348 RepID=A0A501XSL8_9SPHN|nr:hypothetical protein [Sandaracinobacter neustonicus]TPE63097.1 hypothetical protein FJQ54_04425 [Sandaracinobacter neustonicus]